MKAVILGAGVVGIQIARQLINEGKDVVLIEKNRDRARYVSEHLDCMVINEEGNSVESLKKAGIQNADVFISATNSDEVNMISCGMVNSEFTVPIKIARIRNLEYSRARITEQAFLGINCIVNPEVETARQIANTIALGADSDVMLFENTDLQMRNMSVQPGSYFRDKKMKDIRKGVKESFLAAGIIRGSDFIIPTGDTVLRLNDNLYLLATRKDFTKLFIKAGKKQEKFEKIVIVGGGRIGSLVCQYLIRTGRKITIIERNYDRCKVLSEEYPAALVINGDIADEDIFADEELNRYDLIITTTENEELNILSAVFAESMGTKRSIALVTKSNYLPIASKLGLYATVSPKNSTVDAILKFVRRGNIKSVHSLFDGKAEVIEFTVIQGNPISNKKIKNIKLPENSLILTVSRGGESMLPGGDIDILPGDVLLIIARKESIPDVENLFFTQGDKTGR